MSITTISKPVEPSYDSCNTCAYNGHPYDSPCWRCNFGDMWKAKEETTKFSAPTMGIKHDNEKIDWTLLPFKELEEVVQVLEFGAKKYSRDNWKTVEVDRYKKALMRHTIAYTSGEITDPESGKSHLAHVICNALFILWNEKNAK